MPGAGRGRGAAAGAVLPRRRLGLAVLGRARAAAAALPARGFFAARAGRRLFGRRDLFRRHLPLDLSRRPLLRRRARAARGLHPRRLRAADGRLLRPVRLAWLPSRPPRAVPWLTLPALWMAIEWLRTYIPFGGFPWNLIGYAGVDHAGFMLSATVGGEIG